MTYRSGEVASFEGSVALLARVGSTDMADRHHDGPFPSRPAPWWWTSSEWRSGGERGESRAGRKDKVGIE